MNNNHYTCPHCGTQMVPNLAVTPQPAIDASWARAFGEGYFDSLASKEQLVGLLSQWEDVSYRNDMMPSFILHFFRGEPCSDDEPTMLCLKLWCGFHEGDGSFIANVFIADEDEAWLRDLGSACDLMALISGDKVRGTPPTDDDLIDALQSLSTLSMTDAHEVLLRQQLQGA